MPEGVVNKKLCWWIDRTKKYVVVLNVLDTEDIKLKHAVEKRASDGIFKNLIIMPTRHKSTLKVVWNKIIAEIQMVNQQFGAIQQMQIKDGIIVIQMILKVCRRMLNPKYKPQNKD